MKLKIKTIIMLTLISANVYSTNDSLLEKNINIQKREYKTSILSMDTESLALYKEKWWKKALKIAGKDLAGGLAGFVTGSVTPGLGNGVGLLVGGVASSLQAAGGIINPNSGSDNSVENINNKYDFVGKQHVKILSASLNEKQKIKLKTKGQLNYDAFIQFTRKQLINDNIYNEKELNKYGVKELTNDLNFVSKNKHLNLVEFSKKLVKLNKITVKESSVLELYFSEMNSINSINSFKHFVEFSIQLENIISDSDYPESSKELLLSTMSTARHDLNFWILNGHLLN